MDPVIPPNILTAIAVIAIGGPLAWLALRWAVRAVARKRARLVEPSTHGDDGGRPALDRTLKPWRAGDMTGH